jgi:hypothetical protein
MSWRDAAGTEEGRDEAETAFSGVPRSVRKLNRQGRERKRKTGRTRREQGSGSHVRRAKSAGRERKGRDRQGIGGGDKVQGSRIRCAKSPGREREERERRERGGEDSVQGSHVRGANSPIRRRSVEGGGRDGGEGGVEEGGGRVGEERKNLTFTRE